MKENSKSSPLYRNVDKINKWMFGSRLYGMDDKYRVSMVRFYDPQSPTQATETEKQKSGYFSACVQQHCPLIGLVRGGLVSVSPCHPGVEYRPNPNFVRCVVRN
ncbi:hypothetical protein J6590_068828 [Homalodisca vitripennis]|nr:hypothetical protein J6590_068828 [Homalodisca vitripennis]